MELNDLRSYKFLQTHDNSLAAQVQKVYRLTYETINGISKSYDNYTMHDMNHGLRVAAYMEELAFGLDDDFEKNICNFNALEIALMILSAMLHDIGMFIRPEDKDEIKNGRIKYNDSITYEGVLKVTNDEDEAIKEIIRITHAARIQEFITYKFDNTCINDILLVNDSYPYSDDIISICKAHGEDYKYIRTLRNEITKGNYTYNPQYIAVLLRVADYLDLDKQRTPILWYSIMGLKGFSKEEWEKHFIIQNERKLRKYINNKLQIYFDGVSSNAKIHRRYLKYIDEIKAELENADELLNTPLCNPKYAFNVSTKVDDCVQTKGFKYSDLRLVLDYSSITNLLMGENIYGDRKLGLRELVQNSIDACKIMMEIKGNNPDIPNPSIGIYYSEKNNYVKIKDTGIGMTLEIVKKHFLNVGKSYYRSNEYLHKNYSYKPIGQFGIGFLACFLLSDNVVVKTKYYNSSEINQIELEKNSEYVVTNTEEPTYFFGTEIRLDYKKFFEVFSDAAELISFLEKYFNSSIPIQVFNDDNRDETFVISNSCSKIIEREIEESSKDKYQTFNCSEYSKVFDGIIKLKNHEELVSDDPAKMNESVDYIYNKRTQKFENASSLNEDVDGFYIKITYSKISDEDYVKISKTRKNTQRKRTDIIALSQKNKKECNLFVRRDNIVRFSGYYDSSILSINGVGIEKVLTDSGLNYFKEMFYNSDFYEMVYVHNNRFIPLKYCTTMSYRRAARDYDSRCFYFYNKDILVEKYCNPIFLMPSSYEFLGTVNYSGNSIKLDVSRNFIIEGETTLEEELNILFLKYFCNTQDLNSDFKEIVENMIEHIRTNYLKNSDE